MIDHHGTTWRQDPNVLGPEALQAFASLDSVFALSGQVVSKDLLCQVVRVHLDNQYYFVKKYAKSDKKFDRFGYRLAQRLTRHRVRIEWENLLSFADWKIPAAQVVAFGMESTWGVFERGALITAELVNTNDLGTMARKKVARLQDRDWMRSVLMQVARMTRTMHDHGFAHNDLKWRNILVTQADNPQVYFIDCPSGAYWWQPFLSYRIIKDLACLDKVARQQLSRTQRLHFYLTYVGKSRLQKTDKRHIRKILAFFEGRE